MGFTAVDYGTMVMLLILWCIFGYVFIKDLLHAVIVYGAYT